MPEPVEKVDRRPKRRVQTARIAVVGAGMYAHRHMKKWRQAGAEVVAVAEIKPEILTSFADTYGIESRYTDYRTLLQADGHAGVSFDIVDICTPPWQHAPVAFAALEAGKHVLCEKPLALTAAEAEAMADAADAADKILACRLGATRLTWQARTVRDAVRSGALGEVYFMRLVARTLYRPGIEYNPAARWFLDRSKAGGGVLYDVGVYDLDLLFGIFGPFQVVQVMASTFQGVDHPVLDSPFDVEEHAVAMLRLRSGQTVYWERAWATHLPEEHRWELYGTEAALSFVPHSEILRVPLDLRLTRYAPGEPEVLPAPPLAPSGPDAYEDFLLAVAGERPPACSGREAAAMLRIIEQVYAAAERETMMVD
jgi:predicted dehydrogenase